MKIILGLLLAFGIGVVCQLTGIPVPAPPVIVGALLVVAMTSGYLLVDYYASHRPNKNQHLCGGPTGSTRDATSTGDKT
jgi:XapX domain-containing protein